MSAQRFRIVMGSLPRKLKKLRQKREQGRRQGRRERYTRIPITEYSFMADVVYVLTPGTDGLVSCQAQVQPVTPVVGR